MSTAADTHFDYIGMLVTPPSYVTAYRHFCTVVGAAQSTVASLEVLNTARLAIASRCDMLVGRGRGRFSPSRQREIEALRKLYDVIYRRMLAAGWR